MVGAVVDIYNLALNAVGGRNNVSATSEQSREAEVCGLWYEDIRDQILAAAPWPEATKMDYLASVSEATGDDWVAGDPKPGYTYTYGLPADCIRPQYLTTFDRFQVTYYSDTVKALHTNAYQAILLYTMKLDNVSLWGSPLRMAIVYGLAANICMPLSGKPTRTRMLLEQANAHILSAREIASNTSDEVYTSTPDWIAARGYADSPNPASKYYYPYGSLLTVSNVD